MNYLLLFLALVSLTGCSLVDTLSDDSPPPVITEMKISLNGPTAPVLSVVSWTIRADPKEVVTCTLDFGDGVMDRVENCAELTNLFYTYRSPGGYILVLTASTGKHEVSRSLPVVVQAAPPPPPQEVGAP